jgi:hypothetical protein
VATVGDEGRSEAPAAALIYLFERTRMFFFVENLVLNSSLASATKACVVIKVKHPPPLGNFTLSIGQ